MKRTFAIIAVVGAVHFALWYFTTVKTVGHNLDRAIGRNFGGIPPPDTWFTQLVSRTSGVLGQPLEFFLSFLPATADTAPKEVTISEKILGWLFYALNSVLWGGLIYLVWYGFTHIFHRQEAT